jgi:hypothetical protein
MRYYDKEEATRLNAEPWQIDLLNLNPGYISWGPHEDYMWKKGEGWDCPVISKTWSEFGPWHLDEMNECVNFYFSVNRESKECPCCGGNGYHPDAHGVVNSFYSFMNDAGEHWDDKITDDEVKALLDAGRLMDWTRKGITPTAEEVNAAQKRGGLSSHDAINRWILIEARLKRLGLPKTCPECDGHASVFTSPAAQVSLTLWMLHPRKGCSRGIEIECIEQKELPDVFNWLNLAAKRNADRFAKLPTTPVQD